MRWRGTGRRRKRRRRRKKDRKIEKKREVLNPKTQYGKWDKVWY